MGLITLPFITTFSSLVFLPLILFAQEDHHNKYYHKNCPKSSVCGPYGKIQFPLFDVAYRKCGLVRVNCSGKIPKIYFDKNDFEVKRFLGNGGARVTSPSLQNFITFKDCEIFNYLTRFDSPSISFTITPTITLFKCYNSSDEPKREFDKFFYGNYSYTGCPQYTVYYSHANNTFVNSSHIPRNCELIRLPFLEGKPVSNQLFSFLSDEFTLGWNVSSDCMDCHREGGRCSEGPGEFYCKKGKGKERRRVLILATVLPGFFIAIFALGILTIRYRKKWKDASSYISSRTFASDASSKPDLEEGGFFFGVPVFSYAELEEATNYFDAMKELGDGGFGTVYFGKLRDGREVAVKRLYEHNYKRAIQFRNEVEILTRLRHHNLVNLYGCTSHHSRELLLVYEYISNGTVADHLHGDRAKDKTIMWPIRINIAIETASALAYLHASDIIHRDVKTNNILLDDNFCVKVADFGLSRLFPNNVTHVSTAPQGTPGYVDPEYHQCYQLTEKSDVYSFGVVLIELISSLPAVDINRRRHEINLANLAMNKIQKGAFDELIDPRLESASDPSIERMVTSVAEVAFRCLQLEKEMRPSMDEVLDTLREIREYKDEKMGHRGDDFTSAKKSPHSAKGDDIILLKTNNIVPHSPNSVADRWVSTSASLSSG